MIGLIVFFSLLTLLNLIVLRENYETIKFLTSFKKGKPHGFIKRK